ncbi:MAG: hypothetical protein LBS70_07010 [Candidatus Accumulibacter sp.]|jgi:hypothetical protein|nr:hypothetical protein [Accumulibacter sp.]
MTTIGFHGGHSIYGLGTVSDVILFFNFMVTYVVQSRSEQDWSLLTDRLYRRYLRQEELARAAELMSEVRFVFSTLPSSSVTWKDCILKDNVETKLNLQMPTLADIFAKYFENFSRACASAISFVDCFKIYQPVKIVIIDQPWFLMETQRPLNEYDELKDNPFWWNNSQYYLK